MNPQAVFQFLLSQPNGTWALPPVYIPVAYTQNGNATGGGGAVFSNVPIGGNPAGWYAVGSLAGAGQPNPNATTGPYVFIGDGITPYGVVQYRPDGSVITVNNWQLGPQSIAAIYQPATGRTIAQTQAPAANNNVNAGSAGIPQGGQAAFSFGGGNMNNGINIGQLLAAQQQGAALSASFSTIQPLLVAQTTAPTKGGYGVAILGFILSALGFANGTSAGAATSSQAALLASVLGANTVSALYTATTTLMAALQLPAATFTTQATAYNVWLTALNSAISTQGTNALLAQTTSGNGFNVLAYILQQNANAALTTANPAVAVPFTTTTMDSAFASLESSISTWISAAGTNAILASSGALSS